MRSFVSEHRMRTCLSSAFLFLCSSTVLFGDVQVPSFVGKDVRIAAQMAEIAGLELQVGVFYIAHDKWHDDLAEDVIYIQSLRPEATVSQSARIAAWSFRRATPTQPTHKMPDLRNDTIKSAKEQLKAINFRMITLRSAGELDIVLDQYPKPGQVVFEKTSVFLAIDPGPKAAPTSDSQ